MASTQTGDSATEQVKDKAQQGAEQAKSRVRDEVDRRSTEAGEQVTTMADAIRKASGELREQGQEGAAKPLEQAAQRVEGAGQWLRDSDGERILRDVEDFGRRQPLAVLAGGLVAGFAISRLLKASSTERYHGAGATRPRGGQPYGGNGQSVGAPALPPRSVPPTGGPISPPTTPGVGQTPGF
jgi:hypothetical protein